MKDLVFPELSYTVMGILFDIYHTLGGGFQEKYYQKAISRQLERLKMPYLEQVQTDLEIDGYNLGRYYLDFIVDHKIVLEIKAKLYFTQKDIRQVLAYLKKSGLQLGILASFTHAGVKYKRILRGKV